MCSQDWISTFDLLISIQIDMKRIILSIIGGLMLNLALGQTQPPNVDFENWETLDGPISNTYEEPNDWSSSNECTELLNQFAVTKSTDAYSGTYSARMETFLAFANIKVNGMITTAQMICLAGGGGQEGGIPFTDELPDSIVGWFKSSPMANDSAYCQVMFLANNGPDTISYTRINFPETVTSWTRFSAPISPASSGVSSEKLSLMFSSSWGDGSAGEAVVGSILFIDEVAFVYNNIDGIDGHGNSTEWSVYPNPVQGELNIKAPQGENAHIEILDVTGKRVRYLKVGAEINKIDLDQLVAGVYLYQIRSLDHQIIKTGKLLVNP